ncbi:cytochrome c biogenesis protein CcsA [Rufibacter immobilis]|uniref:cytochrome c biogenesis protein CcsA n=1 Tax=Rufibacter immobilis TaxID=1348778 RepID=UPI0035E8D267
MKLTWWKWLTIALLLYTVVVGMLSEVPRLAILNETIRNLYFHVPMWFGMIVILLVSVVYSIKYLRNPLTRNDIIAHEAAKVGILFGVLGIVTGMEWARFTWGEYWSNDPKQNASAIGLLIYFAYLILRGSFQDHQQRARISAVYNVFAFAALIPLLFILPRLTDSLHPGNGGNPGFNSYDLDSRLRAVFYPAVIAWTLLGIWMVHLRTRLEVLKQRFYENA